MIVMRSCARRFRCRSLAKKRIAQRQPSSLLHCRIGVRWRGVDTNNVIPESHEFKLRGSMKGSTESLFCTEQTLATSRHETCLLKRLRGDGQELARHWPLRGGGFCPLPFPARRVRVPRHHFGHVDSLPNARTGSQVRRPEGNARKDSGF
jgi:hypothetical protein